MNSLRHFGSAAEGRVPTSGKVVEAAVMGKDTEAFDILAQHIGHGLETGRIDVSAIAVETNAAHRVKATPGGGLQATGDEDVKYKYAADNELLFTNRQPDIKPAGPM